MLRTCLFVLVLLGAVVLGGCHAHSEKAVLLRTAPILQTLDLTKVQPNEGGLVPILEYHDLTVTDKAHGYQYPATLFRRDMDWLYDHSYRPISLSDYVQGRIDCPAGTSPVILTFDDALRGQFNTLIGGATDPNCAVGILEAIHATHADWPLRGTFFVLTDGNGLLPPPFYQKATAKAKMQHLVQDGFEIGNHTVSHKLGMRHWDDAHVEAEIGGAVVNIHKYLPGYNVREIALPFGVYPKNDALVVSGTGGGSSYHNLCAMKAGYEPAPSPVDRKFDPYHLERIIPGNERFAERYWLDWLETHKEKKFISDGDPTTYTLPATAQDGLSAARLAQGHFHLRAYTGTQLIVRQ